jgi:hypothetical protein
MPENLGLPNAGAPEWRARAPSPHALLDTSKSIARAGPLPA